MGSADTKSYRQRSTEALGFEAPAPHVVVVCPSCKTSFAVETAAVAALETPRFHCSRCDDIFVMKDAPSDILPLGGVQVQSITHTGAHARYSQTRASGPVPESLIKPSDFSLGSSTSSTHSFIEPNPVASSEATTTERSQLSLLNRSVDEVPEHAFNDAADEVFKPTSFAASVEAAPTNEAFTQPRFVLSTPAPAVRIEQNGQAPVSSRQFVLSDPPPTISEPVITPEPFPPHAKKVVAAAKQEPLINPQPLRQAQQRETEAYRPPPPPRRSENTYTDVGRSEKQFSRRMQGLISMSAPILVTLAVLMGVSYCARLSPHSIDTLASYATPSVVRDSTQTLPPSALGVKNLHLSFKKTRNKEVVAVVSGTVLNESGKKFDQVELEVIGFNERGQIIASSRSPLRSALTNEKISDLSLDTVKRFQTQLASNASSITAREAVPFSLALLDGRQLQEDSEDNDVDASQVRYFSARIFSIKKPN